MGTRTHFVDFDDNKTVLMIINIMIFFTLDPEILLYDHIVSHDTGVLENCVAAF